MRRKMNYWFLVFRLCGDGATVSEPLESCAGREQPVWRKLGGRGAKPQKTGAYLLRFTYSRHSVFAACCCLHVLAALTKRIQAACRGCSLSRRSCWSVHEEDTIICSSVWWWSTLCVVCECAGSPSRLVATWRESGNDSHAQQCFVADCLFWMDSLGCGYSPILCLTKAFAISKCGSVIRPRVQLAGSSSGNTTKTVL